MHAAQGLKVGHMQHNGQRVTALEARAKHVGLQLKLASQSHCSTMTWLNWCKRGKTIKHIGFKRQDLVHQQRQWQWHSFITCATWRYDQSNCSGIYATPIGQTTTILGAPHMFYTRIYIARSLQLKFFTLPGLYSAGALERYGQFGFLFLVGCWGP